MRSKRLSEETHEAANGGPFVFVCAAISSRHWTRPRRIGQTGAHFPKSALHRRNSFSRTSERHGHWKIYILVPLSI
jgi:hypothetical protein